MTGNGEASFKKIINYNNTSVMIFQLVDLENTVVGKLLLHTGLMDIFMILSINNSVL